MKTIFPSAFLFALIVFSLPSCKKEDEVTKPAEDTIAPVVSITYPSTGQTVSGTVGVRVNATDNVGVTRVALNIDGSEQFSISSPPWDLSWNTESHSDGSYSITATAYDAAGHRTTSNAVSVTVRNPFVLTLSNRVFTNISVSVSGQGSRTISASSSEIFTYSSNPGTILFTGTTQGSIGPSVSWNESRAVTGNRSASFTLDIDNTIFFIYLKNLSQNPYYYFRVNHGTSLQRSYGVNIPPGPAGNNYYIMGYFEARLGTEVRAYRNSSATGAYVYWIQGQQFTLPFATNQYALLVIPTTGEERPAISGSVDAQLGGAVSNNNENAPTILKSESLFGHVSENRHRKGAYSPLITRPTVVPFPRRR